MGFHINRSSSRGTSKAGLILTGLGEQKLECALRFEFLIANNEAEYKTMIQYIDLIRDVGPYRLVVYSDS